MDADLCSKAFLNVLHQAGLTVESHHDHFQEGTPDEVWLELVGANGWIALSRNREIRHNSFQTDRLMEFQVRAFMLIGHAAPPPAGEKSRFMEELAENFIRTLNKVNRFIEKHEGSFIAKIYRPEQSFRPGNPLSKVARSGEVEMWLSYEQWVADRRGRRT